MSLKQRSIILFLQNYLVKQVNSNHIIQSGDPYITSTIYKFTKKNENNIFEYKPIQYIPNNEIYSGCSFPK